MKAASARSSRPSVLRRKKNSSKRGSKRTAKDIQVLLDWCAYRGIAVRLSSTVFHEFNGGLITINTRHNDESLLYYLLHECGHYMASLVPNLYDHLHGRGYACIRDMTRVKSKPKIDKTCVVIEEIDAWMRGLELAEALGIKINPKKFNLIRSNALQSYFRWSTN
jgi:hypothetical protein